MYKDLYEAWSREKEDDKLQSIPRDFYIRLAEYIRKLRQEGRMLDEKTTKARLLMHENRNALKMAKEIIALRQRKATNEVFASEIIHSEELAHEEEKLLRQLTPSFESFQAVVREILSGSSSHLEEKTTPKKRVLRFIKQTPAIIGADMRIYGPFKPEDVASIPKENAKVLVKQGIAVEIEVKF